MLEKLSDADIDRIAMAVINLQHPPAVVEVETIIKPLIKKERKKRDSIKDKAKKYDSIKKYCYPEWGIMDDRLDPEDGMIHYRKYNAQREGKNNDLLLKDVAWKITPRTRNKNGATHDRTR